MLIKLMNPINHMAVTQMIVRVECLNNFWIGDEHMLDADAPIIANMESTDKGLEFRSNFL